jgi:hypothetical protein
MKKIYFSAVVICFSLSLSAQQTIGFENVLLDSSSYDDGASGAGAFYENGVVFTNEYVISQYGNYFKGFAVSNMQDSTTAGYSNQYSAITASGDLSKKYGIYNPSGKIEFAGQGVVLKSFRITNTTYAALSMRDGDAFGKQFGSYTDANGDVDGTNGADFFRLWTYAHAENGEIIDSVVFYLADYRFSDNTKDYIVKKWETVDFSSIQSTVYSLTFKLESSDVAPWGMNTPAFFAIDNLSVYKNLGLNENTLSAISVFPNPFQDVINIKGESGKVSIIDLTGKEIFSTDYNSFIQISTAEFPTGMYFLTIENERGSFSQKIIK